MIYHEADLEPGDKEYTFTPCSICGRLLVANDDWHEPTEGGVVCDTCANLYPSAANDENYFVIKTPFGETYSTLGDRIVYMHTFDCDAGHEKETKGEPHCHLEFVIRKSLNKDELAYDELIQCIAGAWWEHGMTFTVTSYVHVKTTDTDAFWAWMREHSVDQVEIHHTTKGD